MAVNTLDICHVNVRSLNLEKVDAIKAELVPNFEIICLSETHLPHANVTDLNINGFHNIFRKDRVGKAGGGVGDYVAQHLCAIHMTEYEIPDLEAMWLKIKAGHNVFMICICYRPPNSKADFWVKLQDTVDQVKQSGVHNIFITGDFNSDPHTRDGQLLDLFVASNNFSLHIDKPTRITPTTATILDQFISNVPSMVSNAEVLDPIATCDHCPISLSVKLKSKYNKPKAYKRHVWHYNQANFDDFRLKLLEADWDVCFEHGDIDGVAGAWTSTVLNIARECIPNKVVLIRPNDKTFFTPELRYLRRKKNRAHRKAKNLNTQKYWDKFKEARNTYNSKIKEAKSKDEEGRANTLKNSDKISPKQWWRLAKSFVKKDKTQSSLYPPISLNNQNICDDQEKAEAFNEFFLTHSNIDASNAPLPDDTTMVNETLPAVTITEKDVSDLLKTLDTSKATGPDQISQMMLKQTGDAIVPSLVKLFNLSLRSSKYPSEWKKANVIPIFKKGDASSIDNYRPVSILSCVGKLFERAVFKYVYNFLRDGNAISIKQSGFKPGDSTVYQLAHLYHIFCEAIDKQKDIRVVFCDISKAFDRVWHSGLLAKLKKVGITDDLLNWFRDYLSLRKQRVVINGQSSSWGNVSAGVPQGSVLGPLLFLIYINDITDEAQSSEIRLFADDTILYILVDNPVTSAAALNDDLKRIGTWASKWLVRFSAPKTKTMYISKKKQQALKPQLKMSGTALDEVESFKHLGVTISKDLSWHQHIENLATTAGKCLDILNALKYKLDRTTLEKLYFVFIRSKLEYANIVWDNCSKQLSDILEGVQYRAAKIISGAINRTSHNIIYKELCWQSLEDRRYRQRLRVLYKTMHGQAPEYLQNTIPAPADGNQRYALRENNIPTYRARTSAFHNSFIPKSIRDWNKLETSVKNADTLETFTSKLDSDLCKVPKWFTSGDRRLSILHAKLRMLCSNLNDHLFSHIHVVDSPACACGYHRENNKHYFIDCPLFINERVVLLDNLERIAFKPSISNLLYGNDSYSVKCNIEAFGYIQDYIRTTKRFD